jgi:uncharacterized membrane protein
LNLLISGLVLFLATHFIPSFPKLREILVDRLKLTGYKASFNLLSILSIVLIVYGLKEATFQPLYEPPSWGHYAAMFLMLPAIYFFLSNSVGPAPSSAKVITAHPLNWGVILWATGHMLANGDLANVLLFSTFWLFGVISIVTGNSRGLRPKLEQRPPLAAEAVFVAIVVIVYCALVWGHSYFTGMPLIDI